MSIFAYFRTRKNKDTASIAKERLQIIVAHERQFRGKINFLPALQEDILEVVRKYVNIEMDQVKVNLDQQGDCSILEVNCTLPES